MQKLMGDEGWGGGPCFSLLTPSVCDYSCHTVNSIINAFFKKSENYPFNVVVSF